MTRASPDGPLAAVIADDEALARRRIAGLLADRPAIALVGQAATGPATLETVRRLDPDVLFLDVQMPGLTGFEVLARLEPAERPAVVFSTAYDEYALAAFDAHAVDYLLKPFSDQRFEESLDLAIRAVRAERLGQLHDRLRGLLSDVAPGGPTDRESPPASTFLDRFAVPAGDRLKVIPAAAVDRIEAAGDYVRLHASGETHLLRATMSALVRRLDPARFLRIHRSAIVQLDRVRQLRTDAHGACVTVLEDGARVRVGRRYRDALLERLGTRP